MWGPLPQHMSNALTAVKGVLADTSKALGDAVGGIKKKAADAAQGAVDQAKQKAGDAVASAKQKAEEGVAAAKQKAMDAAADAKKNAEQKFNDTLADVQKRAGAAGDKIKEIGDKAKEEIAKKAQEAREGAAELTEWGKKKVNGMVDEAKQKAQEMQKRAEDQVKKAGAAVAREVDAAKKAIGEKAENVANLFKTIYANAGNWSSERDHTNFVLVSGRYVVNCKWLGDGDLSDLPKEPTRPQDQAALEKIKNFMKVPGAAMPPSVLGYEESLKAPLAREGEMYAFIGDLHMHPFHLSVCDNFAQKKPDGTRESLAKELLKFINHATGQGLSKEHIVQVGDCMEIWEAQILAELACEDYIKLVNPSDKKDEKPPENSAADKDKNKEKDKDKEKEKADKPNPLINICKKYKLDLYEGNPPGRDKARQTFREKCSMSLVNEMLGLQCDVPEKIKADFDAVCNYFDSSVLEKTMKSIYKKLYQLDLEAVFTTIRGNHDNGVQITNDLCLPGSIGTEQRESPYEPYKMGEKNCIWYQHGDALDPFNCRPNFDLSKIPYMGKIPGVKKFSPGGYLKTKDWIGYEANKAKKSVWGTALWEGLDLAASGGLIAFTSLLAARMKYGCLTDDPAGIVMGKPGAMPRLIVLGHSHITTLSDDLKDELMEAGGVFADSGLHAGETVLEKAGVM